MVIVHRKGKMRARTMIEFDMDIYDLMYCQARDSGKPIRDIVDRCVRAGINQVIKEVSEQNRKELELERKYGQEKTK